MSVSMRRARAMRQWNTIRANTDFISAQNVSRGDGMLWREFYRVQMSMDETL
jgi:hypothetical protein